MEPQLLKVVRKHIQEIEEQLTSPSLSSEDIGKLKETLLGLIAIRDSQLSYIMPTTEQILNDVTFEGDDANLVANAPFFSKLIDDTRGFTISSFERFIKDNYPKFWPIIPGSTVEQKRKVLIDLFKFRPVLKHTDMKIVFKHLIFYLVFRKEIESGQISSDGSYSSIIQQYLTTHTALPSITEASFKSDP